MSQAVAGERRGALAALQIRPEEVGRSALFFLYLFLASVVFTTGRTARDALFLSAYAEAKKWLPFMFMGYGLVAALVTPLYASLNDRFRRDRFNAGFSLLLCASYLLARVLIWFQWRPIYSVLYIWVEVTNNFLIVQFWTLANDLHDPREAKRLFGVIGSSRMIGIVICGLAVGGLVGLLGTANLLLVNAGLLLLITFLILQIGQRYLKTSRVARALSSLPEKATPSIPLWRNRYILLIVGMIVFTYFAATLADYQFKILAKQSFPDQDKLAAFFALFYSTVGAAAFFFHFFVSSRLLARFGVVFGLMVMPVLMGVSSIWLLLSAGSLMAVSALKLSDNAFQFTINDAALQLLYYPFPAGLKSRLKALLEGAIKPVSYGLGGLALVLLAGRFGPVKFLGVEFPAFGLAWSPITLSWVVIPSIVVWIIILLSLHRPYVKALVASLASRRLEPGGIEITATPEVIQQLSNAARSDNDYLFEFAVDELVRLDPREARFLLEDLLEVPTRRRSVLLKLSELGTSAEWVRPYLSDPDREVRAAAIWALASVQEEEAIEELSPLLKSAESEEADAACAALIRFAGLEGILTAGEHLRKLLEGDESCRIRAGQVLGQAGVREFYRPVLRLLSDPSLAVRREAIRAAGSLKNRRLLPPLIQAIGDNALRGLALSAIEQYHERALEPLSQALADPSLALAIRERLPRLIRKINRPEAVTILWSHADEKNERLRIPILHHGERLQEKWALAIDRNRLRELLHREGITATLWLHRWKNLRPFADDPLLQEALDQALYWCGRRVFSLLRLLYGPDTIGRIRYNLESEQASQRASALETLDNLLAQDQRAWIVPLLDVSERARAVSALTAIFPEGKESPELSLRQLGAPEHPYFSALLFRARLQKGERPTPEEIADLAQGAGSLLLEELVAGSLRLGYDFAPLFALARQKNYASVLELENFCSPSASPAQFKEGCHMLTTLERVLFLKRVPLFARVPGEDLARLAQEATVVEVEPNQDLFHKGDPGDSMFLIVSGEVSVHLDQTELVRLKEEDFFGEMAMLDQEPRSATVTALTPLTLLKITREDFLEIMADRPEIARAIFEVLSKRLRQADEEIRRLSCAEQKK